jgi:hypothetical protein
VTTTASRVASLDSGGPPPPPSKTTAPPPVSPRRRGRKPSVDGGGGMPFHFAFPPSCFSSEICCRRVWSDLHVGSPIVGGCLAVAVGLQHRSLSRSLPSSTGGVARCSGPSCPGGLRRPICPPLGASTLEDRALADVVFARGPTMWKQSARDGAEACAVGDISH